MKKNHINYLFFIFLISCFAFINHSCIKDTNYKNKRAEVQKTIHLKSIIKSVFILNNYKAHYYCIEKDVDEEIKFFNILIQKNNDNELLYKIYITYVGNNGMGNFIEYINNINSITNIALDFSNMNYIEKIVISNELKDCKVSILLPKKINAISYTNTNSIIKNDEIFINSLIDYRVRCTMKITYHGQYRLLFNFYDLKIKRKKYTKIKFKIDFFDIMPEYNII